MRKRPFSVEWHVAESDAEWDAMRAQQSVDAPAGTQNGIWRWGGSLALLLLIGLGGWYWQQRQRTEAPHAAPIAESSAVAAESTELDAAGVITDTQGTSTTTDSRVMALPYRTEIFTPDVVRMLEHPEEGIHAYQQTAGSLREFLRGALWGAERELETQYFRLTFRQRDEQTVGTAALQLDQLYAMMQANLGVTPHSTGGESAGGKVLVQVSEAYQQTNAPYRTYDIDLNAPIVVSSPALYPVLETWSAADLFAQSVALSLLDRFLTGAVDQYGFGTARDPVVNGVRLWQLWTLPLPLAEQRAPLVQWLYKDLPNAVAAAPMPLPATYTELCASHTLWMAHPAHLHIPLLCTAQDSSPYHLAAWRAQPPPTTLPWLNTPHYIDEEADHQGRTDTVVHPGAAIALATVVEYIVHTYGPAMVPTYLREAGRYDAWEIMIPTLFGVPAQQFEAEWQQYVREQYLLHPYVMHAGMVERNE